MTENHAQSLLDSTRHGYGMWLLKQCTFFPQSKQARYGSSVGFRLQDEVSNDRKKMLHNAARSAVQGMAWLVWSGMVTFVLLAKFKQVKEWLHVLHNLTWQTCFK